MAVWQTKINISPVDVLESGWTSWCNYELLCKSLSEILQEEKSWHKNLRCWGRQGGNQIDLWTNTDETGNFVIRIDLREDNYDFVNSISNLLSDLGLKIEFENTLVDPSVDSIFNIIGKSNASKFVRNPLGYIETLSRNH
jgi:hypothetical protein